MHPIDYLVLFVYFATMIGVGFWYQRRAAKDLDSYFLGGKSMHWAALAMSGAIGNYDISGTMWIVTLIVLLGMKSMWNHWMWGFLMGAFFMAYMGKWVRRSNVMTGAEWMVTRFGSARDGQVARLSYTLMAVVTLTAFVAYAFQGVGKFAAVYVDLRPVARLLADLAPGYSQGIWFCADHQIETWAIAVFIISTLYVLLGGLYSVVVTHIIQTVILTAASILIAAVAYFTVTPELLAERLPEGFTSLVPTWHLSQAEQTLIQGKPGYEFYGLFGLLAVVWVVKGLLLNMGGPGQMYDFQTFLAARSPRDAAKLGAAWSVVLIVRWAMCMGIALMAMTGLVQSSDPEQVMPMVLQRYLGPGLRGLVIAGLVAAFMSTFSATVNAAASYIVRDFWQPLCAPRASQRHLVWAGYAATLAVVVVGAVLGVSVESVGAIFTWIMMELGAAFVIPNVLRWYWWRLNGWGYSAGTLVGLAAALAVPWLPAAARPLYFTFPSISALSLAGCLAGTWLTRPTDRGVLAAFYCGVRPFGLWSPIRRMCCATSPLAPSGRGAWGEGQTQEGAHPTIPPPLTDSQLRDPAEGPLLAAVNVLLGGTAVLGLYLWPMYLVGHWHGQAALCLALAAASCVALYFTWYRRLPEGR